MSVSNTKLASALATELHVDFCSLIALAASNCFLRLYLLPVEPNVCTDPLFIGLEFIIPGKLSIETATSFQFVVFATDVVTHFPSFPPIREI